MKLLFSVLNIDETLAVSDNLLFETATEEIPASLDSTTMNLFLQRLYDTESGKRMRAVNDQLKKAVKLYNLKGIKRRHLYTDWHEKLIIHKIQSQ